MIGLFFFLEFRGNVGFVLYGPRLELGFFLALALLSCANFEECWFCFWLALELSLIGYSTEFRSLYKCSMTDSMGGKAASAVQSRMNFAA